VDRLAALGETLSFKQHCTGSKSDYVQATLFQLLSKNPVCVKRREGYMVKWHDNEFWVCNQLMFGFVSMKFAEHIVNTFRYSRMTNFIFTERFHTEKKNRFTRTSVINATFLIGQHHEESRRTAAEQMGSPFRSVIKFMIKYPFFTEPRNWDPVTLGNLASNESRKCYNGLL
jgi:hypothetical protein